MKLPKIENNRITVSVPCNWASYYLDPKNMLTNEQKDIADTYLQFLKRQYNVFKMQAINVDLPYRLTNDILHQHVTFKLIPYTYYSDNETHAYVEPTLDQIGINRYTIRETLINYASDIYNGAKINGILLNRDAILEMLEEYREQLKCETI